MKAISISGVWKACGIHQKTDVIGTFTYECPKEGMITVALVQSRDRAEHWLARQRYKDPLVIVATGREAVKMFRSIVIMNTHL